MCGTDGARFARFGCAELKGIGSFGMMTSAKDMRIEWRFALLLGLVTAAISCAAPTMVVLDEERSAVIDKAFEEVVSYDASKKADCVGVIDEAIVDTLISPEARRAMEARLAAVLMNPDSMEDAKRYVCSQLYRTGAANSTKALAPLLTDVHLSDDARFALEREPSSKAGKALREALNRTGGRTRVGLINSVAMRRDTKAVGALSKMIDGPEKDVALAAARGLGRIGSTGASRALLNVRKQLPDERLLPAIDAALIVCADALAGDGGLLGGKRRRACKIYDLLCDTSADNHIRVAALWGMTMTPGGVDDALLEEALKGDNIDMRRAAIGLLREGEDAVVLEVGLRVLNAVEIPVETQVLIITALGDRGDARAMEMVAFLTGSHTKTVRLAAIQALEGLVDELTYPGVAVVALAQTASRPDVEDDERDAARLVLERLTGSMVDGMLRTALSKATETGQLRQMALDSEATRAELTRALARRGAEGSFATLLELTADKSERVRTEAIGGLKQLAGQDDVRTIVELLPAATTVDEREAIEDVIVAVCRRLDDAATPLAALQKAAGRDVRRSLLRVVGELATDDCLTPVVDTLESESKEERAIAVRALSDWPDEAALPVLIVAAPEATELKDHVLLMRGVARLLSASDLPARKKLASVEAALNAARRDEEKKALLGVLGTIRDKKALRLAKSYVDNDALSGEASTAVSAITAMLDGSGARNAKPIDRKGWKATASPKNGDAKAALDGNIGSRWATGASQKGGEWLVIDLGKPRAIQRALLDAGKSKNDYPRGYEVHVSQDGKKWGKAIAVGKGNGPKTDILLGAVRAQYIKFTQTGKVDGKFWSVHELTLFGE